MSPTNFQSHLSGDAMMLEDGKESDKVDEHLDS